jgi:acetylornithine deacetylase/succinyl-diaminopimelate desuccinylase-like protein
MRRIATVFAFVTVTSLTAQTPQSPDWARAEDETMRHFQALLRFDTSDPPSTPPGGEKPAADYLKQIFDKEGIPAQVLSLEPNRPNVIARLKGNGSKRPLLLMAHTDVVNVDPKKWAHPPFSATREGGYVY